MKYYLIIGYQTLEKFRDYGRIQLYFNDLLLEDFTADEENGITNIFHNTVINADTEMLDTIKHSKRPKEDIVESPLIYKGRTFHSVNELIDKQLLEVKSTLKNLKSPSSSSEEVSKILLNYLT